MTGGELVLFNAIKAAGPKGLSLQDLVATLYRPGKEPETARETVRKLVSRMRRRPHAEARLVATVRRINSPTIYRIDPEECR